jgi:hypothetical protein
MRSAARRICVSFQHFLREQLASSEIVGEKMNKAAILAKNLPLLVGELLCKFDELEGSRRLVQFQSRHDVFSG